MTEEIHLRLLSLQQLSFMERGGGRERLEMREGGREGEVGDERGGGEGERGWR